MSAPRFNIVIGKGGVGKTLTCILNATRAGRSGLKTLLCELNTDESVAQHLGCRESKGEIVQVGNDFHLVNIHPERALQEYAKLKLHLPKLGQKVFEQPMVKTLVDFVPGMSELLMLGKAFNHERETTKSGHPKWDMVIIDSPATGHGVTFLGLPDIIASAVPRGNMHQESAAMNRLLHDRTKTRIDLVTIAERLPVHEALELQQLLKDEVGLEIGRVIVNKYHRGFSLPETLEKLSHFNQEHHPQHRTLLNELKADHEARDYIKLLKGLEVPTFVIEKHRRLPFEGLTEQILSEMLEKYTPWA